MLSGVPAQQLRPGVRWQRPGRFADDPDVGELYAELRAHGRVEVADELGQLAVIAALCRRAAADGLYAQVRIRPAFQPALVALTRPLETQDLDSTPIRVDAARIYAEARAGREQWALYQEFGRDWPADALSERDATSEFCSELRRLARADGAQLRISFDELSLYLALGPTSEQLELPGRG